MKVCVYAICKNEEQFVDRWMASMNEADEIYVLDTGSTDNTISLLKKYPKVKVVQKEIIPWSFDRARNESMLLLPEDTDICVNSDFDQIWPINWRKTVEGYFNEGYNKVTGVIRTIYENGYSYDVSAWYNIHFYSKLWKWRWPVHENLYYDGNQGDIKEVEDRSFIIEHRQDPLKDRKQYLSLLENWDDTDEEEYTRLIHRINLADEYERKGDLDKAISICQTALQKFKETSDAEAIYLIYDLYLMEADCYKNKGQLKKAVKLLDECLEACQIYTRKIFKMKADLLLGMKKIFEALKALKQLLEVKEPYYLSPQKYWLEDASLFKEGGIEFLKELESYVTTWYEWSVLGDCYYGLNDISNSLRCYKTSIILDATEAYPYYYTAKLLAETGAWSEVIYMLNNAPRKLEVNDFLNPPDHYQKARLIWLTQANYYTSNWFRALGYAKAAQEVETNDEDMNNAANLNYDMCLNKCLEMVNGK